MRRARPGRGQGRDRGRRRAAGEVCPWHRRLSSSPKKTSSPSSQRFSVTSYMIHSLTELVGGCTQVPGVLACTFQWAIS